MTKEFFEEALAIPSPSGKEDMMIDFIMNWGRKHGCQVSKDGKGNVTLVKGKPQSGHFYPCVANHMDAGSATHNRDQDDLVERKLVKEIVWNGDNATCVHPITKKQVGLGADDQLGCALAMCVIDKLPYAKGVFVVSEEVGMVGSRAFDKSFFNDCAFIMSNDSPGRNRATHYCSGVQLYSDDFFNRYIEPICQKHGVTSFRSEPYSDIMQYRQHALPDGKHLECFNFGNGGAMNAHQTTESANLKDANAAEELLYALCTEIPTDRQWTSDIKEEPRPTWSYSSYSPSYSGTPSWYGDMFKKSGARQAEFDFEDADSGKTGEFEWKFTSPEKAKAFAEAKIIPKDVKVDFDGKDFVKVSGPLKEIRKAYVYCYNYDNNARYVSWSHFSHMVKNGEKSFDAAVTIKGPERPKDSAEGSVFVEIDDTDDVVKFLDSLDGEDIDVDAEEDTDGQALFGKVGELKKAWICAFRVLTGRECPLDWKEFEKKYPRDAEEFWTFFVDGKEGEDDVIDVEADYLPADGDDGDDSLASWIDSVK